MSSQQYTRKTVKLNQEQSAVLDSLEGWTQTGKQIKWNDKQTGEPKEFFKKYEERPLDESTLGAMNVFAELGLSTYDKAESFSGVFVYTIGKNTLEKEKKYVKKGSTGSTYTGTSKSYDSEGAKRGHEENVQMHKEYKEMHDAEMLLQRELIDSININTQVQKEVLQELRNANRLTQIKLGEVKE